MEGRQGHYSRPLIMSCSKVSCSITLGPARESVRNGRPAWAGVHHSRLLPAALCGRVNPLVRARDVYDDVRVSDTHGLLAVFFRANTLTPWTPNLRAVFSFDVARKQSNRAVIWTSSRPILLR